MEAPPPPPGGGLLPPLGGGGCLLRHLTPQTAPLAAELRGLLPAFAVPAPWETAAAAADAAGSPASPVAAPPPDPAAGLRDMLEKVCGAWER